MLFFASFDEMNKQCYSYRKNMSLQVHDPLLARRAHPCTSSLPASMTVEAALVLPLALLFFLALLQPVIWLDRQRKVQTAMERIGEEISQYGILAESVETEDSELPAFCTDAAAALWIRGKVGQYADHVTVKKQMYTERTVRSSLRRSIRRRFHFLRQFWENRRRLWL